jgi:hypothetical protein
VQLVLYGSSTNVELRVGHPPVSWLRSGGEEQMRKRQREAEKGERDDEERQEKAKGGGRGRALSIAGLST